MMQRILPLALALWLALPAGGAAAHGLGLAAFATMEPARPVAGQPVQLTIEVVDPLGNPVTGGVLEARIVGPGGTSGPVIPFAEERTGFYSATLQFAADGDHLLRARLTTPGREFAGDLPVVVGAGAYEIRETGFELEYGPPGGGFSWITWLIIIAAVILAGELVMRLLRRGKR